MIMTPIELWFMHSMLNLLCAGLSFGPIGMFEPEEKTGKRIVFGIAIFFAVVSVFGWANVFTLYYK